MTPWMKNLTAALAGAVAMSVVVLTTQAIADQNALTDDVARLLPYRGRLEQNGVAVNGSVEMTFTLTSSTTAGEVWSETQTVPVSQGDFSVLLGSTGDASAEALAALFDGSHDLYLSISVGIDGETVPLASNQRLLPVPMAVWTTASTDFYLRGTAIFEGEPVDGSGEAPLTVSSDEGTLAIDGSTIAASADLGLLVNGGTRLNVGAGGLTVNGLLSFEGDAELSMGEPAVSTTGTYLELNATVADRGVDVSGDVMVGGDLWMQQGMTASGKVTVGGTLDTTVLSVDGTLSVAADVTIAGTLDIAYTVVSCTDSNSCQCASGYILAGGASCEDSSQNLVWNYSNTALPDIWLASCSGGSKPDIRIICADIPY